jgi:tetratricopeptide (TPR) repeat protein
MPELCDPANAVDSVERLYRAALESAENEDYQEALRLLEEGRRRAPEHVGLYLSAAQILATELEEFRAAEEMLAAAERIRPGGSMIAFARADLKFHRGDLDGAEQGFRQLAGQPDADSLAAAGVSRVLVARARRQMDRGRYRPALEMLREAGQWDATAAVHLSAGTCYHRLGSPQEAFQHLTLAIDLDGYNPVAFFQMGALMADCGEIERAAAAFAQTLTVDADYPEARHRLASMQSMLGNVDAAINVLKSELDAQPDCAECHYLTAIFHVSQGNTEAAVSHLEQAACLRPSDFLATYQLGTLHAAAGRAEEARPHLERARQLDPQLFAEEWANDEQLASVRNLPEFTFLAR